MKYDFLIIGQGLAGSLLYYELAKRGKKVLVIHPFEESIKDQYEKRALLFSFHASTALLSTLMNGTL